MKARSSPPLAEPRSRRRSRPECAKTVNTVDGERGQTRVLRTCEPQRSIHDRVPVEGSTREIHQGPGSSRSHQQGRIYACNLPSPSLFTVLATGDGSIYAARRRTSDGHGWPACSNCRSKLLPCAQTVSREAVCARREIPTTAASCCAGGIATRKTPRALRCSSRRAGP